MELSKQCCTLEQAKKLKELGVNAESIFQWNEYEDYSGIASTGNNDTPENTLGHHIHNAETREIDFKAYGRYIGTYSAFTVSEMQLVDGSLGNIELSEATYHKGEFYSTVNTEAQNWDERFRYYKTLAEAWGDKLIRALEKGYYTVADCNTRLTSN